MLPKDVCTSNCVCCFRTETDCDCTIGDLSCFVFGVCNGLRCRF